MPAIQRWAVDFDHLDLVAAQVPGQAGAGVVDSVGGGKTQFGRDLDFRWARDLVMNRRAGRSRSGR